MSKNTLDLLSKGLQAGFAGGTDMQEVVRGGQKLKSSHFKDESGEYHDEWFADRAGGGQEIVITNDETYTRVYAGGTIPEVELEKIGITGKDVMGFLKKLITKNGDKTRLDSDFEPVVEGDWQYSYKILDKDLEIPLTLGKEVIRFKGQIVFIHDFIISPVD